MNKTVVVYSGGLDSTVLLTQCKQEYDEVIALNFDYGSKHNWSEREAAKVICKMLSIPLYLYDLPALLYGVYDSEGLYHPPGNLFTSNLLKSGGEIPEGCYEEDSMKQTVVPFRNGVMLSLATGFAESREFNTIAIANHAGDHEIYADCRPGFIRSFQEAIRRGTDKKVYLSAPFTNFTKAEIVKLGSEIGAPLELTWSCYKGEEYHCGMCATCRERKEAFELAGVSDPTEHKNTK